MNYQDGVSSHFSLWQNQVGHGSAHSASDDRRSVYSADSRRPPSIREPGTVTPAQAYARAVKTGDTYDGTLYYTIERKQPESKEKANPHLVPSHLSDSGSLGHGPSFAQRLYASARSHKSANTPSSDLPVLPPIGYTSSSALSTSGNNQASSGVPPRTTSLSTSISDTSSEASQSFNAADLYHSSVATHRFASRSSSNPEASVKRPPPVLPALQIPNSLPAARSHPRASYSLSQNTIPRPEVRNPSSASHQSQTMSMEVQPYSPPVAYNHEASSLHGASVEARPSVIASRAMSPLLPLEQQLVTVPSPSPPAFEEHEQLSNPYSAVTADVAPADVQSHAAIPREDGLLQLPPDVTHEEVPLYTLVDEQLPPPAFDDLQITDSREVSAAESLVAHPERLSQEEISVPHPPSQSPPPFSQSSATHVTGKTPAYVLLDKTSHLTGTGKNTLQDVKVSRPTNIYSCTPGPSWSDPPSVPPTDFRSPNSSPLASPVISPLSSNFHSLSVLSPHLPNSKPVGATISDPYLVRGSTTTPPPVNYHTKPAAKQSRQPLLPPPALRSGFRPLEGSNTVRRGRLDRQPVFSVVEGNYATDGITHSMSSMMGGPLLGARTLAFETLPSCGQNTLGPQQNNLIIPGFHPSGTRGTTGSPSQGIPKPETERLIQEAYRRPTHGETGGRAVYGIQGSGSGSLHGSWQGYAG